MVGITSQTINPSLQIGDEVWSAPVYLVGGMNTAAYDVATKIGRLSKLEFYDSDQTTVLTVFMDNGEASTPGLGDFIFFNKNKDVNAVAPIGYYAKITMAGLDVNKSELFSVGCVIKESSK